MAMLVNDWASLQQNTRLANSTLESEKRFLVQFQAMLQEPTLASNLDHSAALHALTTLVQTTIARINVIAGGSKNTSVADGEIQHQQLNAPSASLDDFSAYLPVISSFKNIPVEIERKVRFSYINQFRYLLYDH
jgi:hypothetical protein